MILVALGANLSGRFGTPRDELAAALKSLEGFGVRIVSVSSLWLTEPVPVSDQPVYHNAVARVHTELSPYELLEVLQGVELAFGRVRTVRNAPRVLDLDLIACGNVVLDKPELIVPHPRMQDRAFVLKPMAEIVPEGWVHPTLHKTLKDLLAALPDQKAVRDERPFP